MSKISKWLHSGNGNRPRLMNKVQRRNHIENHKISPDTGPYPQKDINLRDKIEEQIPRNTEVILYTRTRVRSNKTHLFHSRESLDEIIHRKEKIPYKHNKTLNKTRQEEILGNDVSRNIVERLDREHRTLTATDKTKKWNGRRDGKEDE